MFRRRRGRRFLCLRRFSDPGFVLSLCGVLSRCGACIRKAEHPHPDLVENVQGIRADVTLLHRGDDGGERAERAAAPPPLAVKVSNEKGPVGKVPLMQGQDLTTTPRAFTPRVIFASHHCHLE